MEIYCIHCKKALPEGAIFCPWCGKSQEVKQRKYRKRANGTGTVYKLSGKRSRPWRAELRGVGIGSYATRREAEEAIARAAVSGVSEVYNITFAELFARWKTTHYQDIGESGRAQYDRAFAVFADLHKRRWRDLRVNDFQTVLDAHRGKSVSTVSKYKQLITQMGEWAVKNEICKTNFASYTTVRGADSKGHEPMTEEEVKRIAAAAQGGNETAMIVVMLLCTGMRVGELFKLPLSDYHGDYLIGGEKSEAGRGRVIPIRPEGRPYFAHFAKKASTTLLDGYEGNKTIKNFRERDYYPFLDTLGIPRSKTPHSTRATYITQAVSSGLAPAVLQKVVGHASFDTTQQYYNKPTAEALVEAIEKASR